LCNHTKFQRHWPE